MTVVHNNCISKKLFLVISIILCVSLFGTIKAFAETGDVKFNGNNSVTIDGSTFTINDNMKDIWEKVRKVYGDSNLDSIKDQLTIDDRGPLWGVVTGIYNAMIPIGYSLMLLFFYINLLNKATSDNFNLERLFKSLLGLLVVALFMSNGLKLINLCMDFSNALMNTVIGGSINSPPSKDELLYWAKICSKFHGLASRIQYEINLLIPALATDIITGVIWVITWSRLVELSARCALFPIGCADLYGEGTRGPGFRFFKKIIALGLQAAVILVIIKCYSGITIDTGDAKIAKIVSGAAVAMLIIKSQGIASDIVGV